MACIILIMENTIYITAIIMMVIMIFLWWWWRFWWLWPWYWCWCLDFARLDVDDEIEDLLPVEMIMIMMMTIMVMVMMMKEKTCFQWKWWKRGWKIHRVLPAAEICTSNHPGPEEKNSMIKVSHDKFISRWWQWWWLWILHPPYLNYIIDKVKRRKALGNIRTTPVSHHSGMRASLSL